MQSAIEFSEAAAVKARALIAAGEGAQALRLSLRDSGCAGMAYTMKYAQVPEAGDEIVETAGLRVYIAAEAFLFLVGMRVDWSESALERGFVFSNPNEVDACGCGESVTLRAAPDAAL